MTCWGSNATSPPCTITLTVLDLMYCSNTVREKEMGVKAAVVDRTGGVPRYQDFPDHEVAGRSGAGDRRGGRGRERRPSDRGRHPLREPAVQPHSASDSRLRRHRRTARRNPRRVRTTRPTVRSPRRPWCPGSYMPIAEGIDPAIATVLCSAMTGMSIKTAAGSYRAKPCSYRARPESRGDSR